MTAEKDTYGWINGRQGSRKPKEIYLYVITENGADQPCKVGYASNPTTRMFTLSCGNPRDLTLRFTMVIPWPAEEKWLSYVDRVQDLERTLHKRFAASRLRGEWFDTHCTEIEEVMRGMA